MNQLLSQLVGSDADRLQALLCRWQTVFGTIDLFQNRIDELNNEWEQTEAEHGEAQSAATTHLMTLQEEERHRVKARIPLVREHAERLAASSTFWYRIYLWIRQFQERSEPAIRIVALAGATKKLNDFDKQSDALWEEILDAKRKVQRLIAPFADVAFARERLSEDLAAADAERIELENSIRDGIMRALVDRPIWAIKQTAALINGLEINELLQLRRDLRPVLAAYDTITQQPPSLKTYTGIDQAVRNGFYEKTSPGRGTVSVTGPGTTQVRKTRWVTDSKGKSRRESYTATVSVSFSGSVDASFNVSYQRWKSTKFGKTMARTIRRRLAQGEQLPPLTDDSYPMEGFTKLFALLGLNQISASP